MVGGPPPPDINKPLPGDDGCRTKRTRMQITTMKGNNSTTPRGTETAELPFNRRGRLKNAHLDVLFLLPASFIVGRSVANGNCFIARRTTSITAKTEFGKESYWEWISLKMPFNSCLSLRGRECRGLVFAIVGPSRVARSRQDP